MGVRPSTGDLLPDQGLRMLLQDALGLTEPLNTNIHENDQMFSYIASARGSESIARSDYFTSGAQLLDILQQLVRWKFGSFDGIGSLLDFASGYGRLTRFLVHKLPPERIWISDTQAKAVAFQHAEFGVHGFVSAADPDDLLCDRKFACIFVASLFSHLPPSTFSRWLKKLCSLLEPGGLIAFSVHDESGLAAGETMPDGGIFFTEGSEIASLSTQDYGRTVVTEGYVRNAITEATGRPAYRRIPHGLLFHQDIYIVVNEPSPDFSGLHFSYLPNGALDYALWAGQAGQCKLRVQGWAACMDDAGRPGGPVEVQVFVDGELRQKCVPSEYRPDVREYLKDDRFSYAGWSASCQVPDAGSTRPLVVKAISRDKVTSLLYAGPVGALLPAGKAESCLWIRPGELYVKGWAADISSAGSPVEVQIFVDGQLRQKFTPSLYRPELYDHFADARFLRAGWECSFSLPDGNPGQSIVVTSRSESGDERLLYRGTIASLEAQGDAAFGQQREALLRLQSDLRERLQYIRHLEAEIARKNAALAKLEAPARRWPWQRHTPRR